MKAHFVLSLLLFLSVQRLCADARTFAEFKALPVRERDNLVAASEDGYWHWKYLSWWLRLYLGEDAWQRKEQDRLADQNGYGVLGSLFSYYQHLQDSFMHQERDRKKAAGMSAEERTIETTRFNARAQAAVQSYQDALPLIASSAPTEEARTLAKQADGIFNLWTIHYPSNAVWVITPADMAAIDQQAQQVMARLKSLPKLTPEQVQAAIEALPDENPSMPTVPFPYKKK